MNVHINISFALGNQATKVMIEVMKNQKHFVVTLQHQRLKQNMQNQGIMFQGR